MTQEGEPPEGAGASGAKPTGTPDPPTSPSRQVAARLFNHTWDLLLKQNRTPDEDDEMIHAAHASRYHWSEAPECTPRNLAVGEWQCARVHSALGMPEAALRYARRSVQRCEEAGIEGFYLGAAYEGLARACLVAGDVLEGRQWEARARAVADSLPSDSQDREVLREDLASLP